MVVKTWQHEEKWQDVIFLHINFVVELFHRIMSFWTGNFDLLLLTVLLSALNYNSRSLEPSLVAEWLGGPGAELNIVALWLQISVS